MPAGVKRARSRCGRADLHQPAREHADDGGEYFRLPGLRAAAPAPQPELVGEGGWLAEADHEKTHLEADVLWGEFPGSYAPQVGRSATLLDAFEADNTGTASGLLVNG